MSLAKAFGNTGEKLTGVSDPAKGWLLTTTESAGHVAQLIKDLVSYQEALPVDITPNMTYIGMVAHACYPSTWEAEVRISECQYHPQLHSEFEASLKYTRPHVKQTKNYFLEDVLILPLATNPQHNSSTESTYSPEQDSNFT